MYFPENLQKTVIQYLHGVILVACIAVAYSHSIPIERAVNDLLALPAVSATGLHMVSKFFRRQQVCVMFHAISGREGQGLPSSLKPLCKLVFSQNRFYRQQEGWHMDDTDGTDNNGFFIPPLAG